MRAGALLGCAIDVKEEPHHGGAENGVCLRQYYTSEPPDNRLVFNSDVIASIKTVCNNIYPRYRRNCHSARIYNYQIGGLSISCLRIIGGQHV